MAKAPSTRGFTIAEKRAIRFEQVSLYAVFLVALIAAAISFVALSAVGADAGLGRASFLLPIAIDGFGIACSVGIVRSVAQGEGFRGRASEWIGLTSALSLSILGNVTHALAVGDRLLPDYVKVAYATAIPVIVAYGIHVYGRAMSKGISAHVLAEDPEQLVLDLAHLGDASVAARRAPVKPTVRAPKAPVHAQPVPRPARAETPAPAQETAPTPRAEAATVSAQNDEQGAARAVFDRMVAAEPLNKPDAARVRGEAGIEKHPATVRRWVQAWWEEHQEAFGTGGADPIEQQAAADQARSESRPESSVA